MYHFIYTEVYGYEFDMYQYEYQARERIKKLRKFVAYRDLIIQVHSIGLDDLYAAVKQ